MAVQPMAAKREFTVADEHIYNHSSPTRWIVSHILRYKTFLTSFVIASAVTALLFSSIPALTGRAFDEVFTRADTRRLLALSLAILGVVLLRGLTDIVNAFSIEVLGQRLERDARDELYISLLGKSQTFHNRQRVGDIMARATNDVRQLNPMMNPGVALITDSLMGILAPLIFIAAIDPRLLISPVLFLIVFVFSLRRLHAPAQPGRRRDARALWRHQRRPQRDHLRHRGGQVDRPGGAGEEALCRNATPAAFATIMSSRARSRLAICRSSSLGFAFTGAFAPRLCFWNQGELSVGQLVAYMGLMGILRFPTFISIFTFSLVQLGLGRRRAHSRAHARGDRAGRESCTAISAPIRGEIVFENVTFGYGDASVLKNICSRPRRARPLPSSARPGRARAR